MNLAILSKLDSNKKVLESLIALFRSSNSVGREEFDAFAESIIRDREFIHNLEWVPKVSHANRRKFEKKARLDGLENFQFFEHTNTGELIRAAHHETYYPVYYIYPMDNNKSALGFSLSSNSILRKAMNKSRDSGNIIASSFIPSINKKESALDLLVLYPHYRGGRVPETLVKRREMLEGFIVSVYRMEKVIEEIIQKKKAKGLNLVVYENARNNDKKNVYGNLLNDQAMELIFPVNIIGHPWLLVWQGSKNYKGGLAFKLSVVSSGAVFAVFFLLATIFEMNLIRTRVIKQEVEQRTAELYRANRDLAQFANIASHDLKAPLRGIAHLSRWIQDDLGENITDEVRGNLDRLVESVKKMDALIRGILEYSRAGKGSSEVKTIRVDSMIREILGLVGVGEDVDVDIQPDMPVFLTDSIKLSQVFSNLISNAIKHNSNENKKLVISSQRKGEFYEFIVADNGPGIASESHEKIFQMFQTLQPGDKFENTGVGLPIVKKLVEEANGFIKVGTAEAGGTAFVFSWPATFANAK